MCGDDLQTVASLSRSICTKLEAHTFMPAALGSGAESLQHKTAALVHALRLESSSNESLARLGPQAAQSLLFVWFRRVGFRACVSPCPGRAALNQGSRSNASPAGFSLREDQSVVVPGYPGWATGEMTWGGVARMHVLSCSCGPPDLGSPAGPRTPDAAAGDTNCACRLATIGRRFVSRRRREP